jgi:hypothetical protein
MRRGREPIARAAEVLHTLLQRIDPEHQLRGYRLWSYWDEEVGASIARRARPARFRNGILFVNVTTHAWLQELQFMKDEIRERLNRRVGTALVRDIFFASGTLDEAPLPAPPASIDVPYHSDAGIDLPSLGDGPLAAAFERVVSARARRIARQRQSR